MARGRPPRKSRIRKPLSGSTKLLRWGRRYRNLLFGAATLGGITAAVLLLANPFGPATATDAMGRTLRAGPLPSPGAAPRVGHEAPNFLLPDYDGRAVRLDDYRGKVVFLNFWATWCTTCEAEMPDMERLAKEYGDDIVVLAVNRGESAGRAQAWSAKRGFQNIVFAVDERESVAGAYKLGPGMPQSFFIDRNGTITRIVPGGQSFSTMVKNFVEAVAVAAE